MISKEIKEFIDEQCEPSRLHIEVINRFNDYFDEDDYEENEEPIDVLARYESEEIPLDLVQDMTDYIKETWLPEFTQPSHSDIYDEVFEYMKEKLRVVFPWYHKFHDFQMSKWKDQQDLMAKLGQNWD